MKCDIRFETPYGRSKCHTCGREWEAVQSPPIDWGSEQHCWRELGSRIAALESLPVIMESADGNPGWGDGRDAIRILAHLREQLLQLDARIVRGFYEEELPSFQQGPPDHEVLEDVTADDCRNWIARIVRLEAALRAIRDATHTSAVVLRGMADDALNAPATPSPER